MLRILIIFIAIAGCGVTLALITGQRRELGALREQEQRSQAQAVEWPALVAASNQVSSPAKQYTPSPELLRLRGEVGQLERRKRELGSVRAENETLRTQLETKGTNALGSIVLPADYIRKANARFAGFNSPEDTIQSMLWAIHNQDISTFVQVFSPEEAKQMQAEIQRRGSVEEFFQEGNLMPGLRIAGSEPESPDTVVLTIEVIPGDESQLQKVRFKQFDGQWKLLSGF